MCLGFDSLDVRTVERGGRELDASEKHRLVDVLRFWHFVVDPAQRLVTYSLVEAG